MLGDTFRPTIERPVEPVAELDLVKVKDRICEAPKLAKELRPLSLFKGSLSEGRIQSLYNLLASAKDAEVGSMTSITKASALLTDPVHYCGLHSTWERMGMRGFCSRMMQSPSVLALESDWRDYIHFLLESSGERLYTLEPISEFAYKSRRPWRVIYRTTLEPMAEHYPFITGKPTDDHELVLAVDALVPKYFAPETRADVCQDMLIAILTGEMTLDNLRDQTKPFIKRVMHDAPSKYGHLSLDAPIIFGDNSSRTLGEMLV